MSTLTINHTGLDRIVRGFETLLDLVFPATPPAEGKRPTEPVDRSEAGESESSNPENAAAQHVAAREAGTSMFAAWRAGRAARRAQRDFEELLRIDPRMRSEFEAMRAHADWHA